MKETRARRRIRQAVESRGYGIESIDYEPWYNAGEMMGIGGGWSIVLDRDFLEHTHPGNDMYALSVEELLAQIDYWVKPSSPCDCDRTHDPMLAARLKGDPCKPTHDPGCPHHLKYHLPGWVRELAEEGL